MVSVTAQFESGVTYTSGLNGYYVIQRVGTGFFNIGGTAGLQLEEDSQSAASAILIGSGFNFGPTADGSSGVNANGLPVPFTSDSPKPFDLGTVYWIDANVMPVPSKTQWQIDSLRIINVNGIPQTPPSVSCTAHPSTLWPPTGRSVVTTISGTIAPGSQAINSGGTSFVVTDSQSTAQQNGTVTPNADGTFSFTVPLVASRADNIMAGRRYTVTVTATDANANQGSCAALIVVPHDQRH